MTDKISKITPTTIDEIEVQKFSAMAQEWWDPNGKFKPLHKFNPTRLAYLKEKICAFFDKDPLAHKPLAGLSILDIGCGGGLLCEPLTRLGAEVVGVDAAADNIKIAATHAKQMDLNITYLNETAEALVEKEQRFDVVLAMEVIEHVADLSLFIQSATKLMKPDGLLCVATINRNLKAWLCAIVAAEYILGWLPRGTHQYEKFVKPEELEKLLLENNMKLLERRGVAYNPIKDSWNLSQNLDINYMLLASHRS